MKRSKVLAFMLALALTVSSAAPIADATKVSATELQSESADAEQVISEEEIEDTQEILVEVEEDTAEAPEAEKSYTIVYDANGGSGTMEAQVAGDEAVIAECAFTKTGYHFTGWECEGEELQPGDTVEIEGEDGDVFTLVAQWEANTFTVKFDANGGTGTTAPVTVTYGVSTPLTKNGFKNGELAFAGWIAYRTSDDKILTDVGWKTQEQIEENGYPITIYKDGVKIAKTSAVDKDEIIMYAVWKKKIYTIQYNANGGTGSMPQTVVTIGVSTPTEKNQFTYGTRDFKGWTAYRESDKKWYTKSNGWQTQKVIDDKGYEKAIYKNGVSVAATSSVPEDLVTFYAQWGPIHYTVQYNANGGTGTMANTVVTYGTSTALRKNAFKKSGYAFAGWTAYRAHDNKWYTKSNGWQTQKVIDEKGYQKAIYKDQAAVSKTTSVDNDLVTVYAQWKKAGWIKESGTWTYYGEYGTFASNKMYEAWSKIATKSSPTKYYLVVDCTKCETYIFIGEANKWVPYKKWICSPGAPKSKTVVGTFSVAAKGYSFSHPDLTCYYYTQFKGDYLFHTIPYERGTWNVKDGRLGMQVSAGCVRLSKENAKWIYDNIPRGSKVLTYY